MAIRCLFSPLPSPSNPVINPRITVFKSTNLLSLNSVHRFDSIGNDRRIRFPRKVRASAEADLLVRREADAVSDSDDIGVLGVHHVGLLCQNLEKSLDFYQNLLGLKINEARPNDKLPYRGAWLWVGDGMIHLMELPNPDPLTGRPEHGGRDRHACIAIKNVAKLKEIFDKAGIKYTFSKSGRPAIFARDPDGNAVEFTQID